MHHSNGTGVIVRTFSGTAVQQRESDGYFNATAMCQANNKKWNDYWRLSSTSAYVAELSAVTGIPATGLVQTVQGGTPGLQGTWVHQDIAIHLAQWCSPKFAVLVTGWVRELLTKGYVIADSSVKVSPVYADADDFDLMVINSRQIAVIAEQMQAERNARRELAKQTDAARQLADEAKKLSLAALKTAECGHGCMAVLGYAHITGRSFTEREAAEHGRKLSAICRSRGIPVQKRKHERYGAVNLYPETILAEYFGDKQEPFVTHKPMEVSGV